MPVGVSRDRGPLTTTMGRPSDDRPRRTQPMSDPLRWVRRATLSALAGGGLTAAALGGRPAGGALGAGAASTPGGPEGPSAPSAPEVAGPSTGSSQGPTSPTTTASTPAPSAPQASGPTGPSAPEAPAVVVQRRQTVTPSNKSSSATQAKPQAGGKTPGNAKPAAPSGPNNVALPPQLVAAPAGRS